MSTNNRVSLGFMRISDAELIAFAENVIVKLTGNAGFPTPIVTIANLTTAKNNFVNAVSAAAYDDRQAIAVKNAMRESFLLLLRKEAAYVQAVAGDDLGILLSSGFNTVPSPQGPAPLPKAEIDKIINEQSTMMSLKLKPLANAAAYEVRMSFGPGGMQALGIFTDSRRIPVSNLAPGTVYTFQARAIGGSTGYSDWSDPVSHMAM